MLNRPDYYAIYTEKSERSGSIDELFETYDEAFKNRMRYANWFRPYGNVWIQKIDGKTGCTIEDWHISEDGTVIGHYDF